MSRDPALQQVFNTCLSTIALFFSNTGADHSRVFTNDQDRFTEEVGLVDRKFP
jgi:hypothetical protein